VQRGNEWVVVGRLEDAEFFYREDRKRSMTEWGEGLETVTYAAELGSYAAKARRMEHLAVRLAGALGRADAVTEAAKRAARLAKVDLVTGMVGEFPELQGVVGGLYLRQDGEPEAVADAVGEHYRPASPDDIVPTSEAGTIVSLADRLDALVGHFAAGARPKGSKDPLGLRRAALGALRIVLERQLSLDLAAWADEAAGGFGSETGSPEIEGWPAARGDLLSFLEERLAFLLQREGIRYDEVAAVAAAGRGSIDAVDRRERARALRGIRGDDDFLSLSAAAKRIRNILGQARDRGDEVPGSLEEAGLEEDAERELLRSARRAGESAGEAAGRNDYREALLSIARIRPVVETPHAARGGWRCSRRSEGCCTASSISRRSSSRGRKRRRPAPPRVSRMSEKRAYFFGAGKADGHAGMRDLLGGKGANLAEMTRIGIPVPAGFTITTEVCTYVQGHGGAYPAGLEEEVDAAMRQVEEAMEARFGDPERPLLVSVRSGSRASMPGMMDTVLNLGLNDRTAEGLASRAGNARFVFDSYRRFVHMYGDVVMGLRPASRTDRDPFEVRLEALKKSRGVEQDTGLDAEDLRGLVADYKQLVRDGSGREFPDDPREQLWGAIAAVFSSWDNPRAVEYRRIHGIPGDWGTAVNVQAMVFGNLGDDCATGVAFTRDPATGENRFYGEWLRNAQGEDVVAGIRTPQPVTLEAKDPEQPLPALEEEMPRCYAELAEIYRKLEGHYRDMQDIEFTIQKGRLWLLQTRAGKRTGVAAVGIATDMVDEGLIDEETAVRRVDPESVPHLMAPTFDPAAQEVARREGRLLARGLGAGPGAAAGTIVFHAEDAQAAATEDRKVLLVREETSPDDVGGMNAAEGILTSRGGMTSHAAVVARQMGKPCIVGCDAVRVDYEGAEMRIGDRTFSEGDRLSIDGTSGEVFEGDLGVHPSEVEQVLVSGTMDREASRVFRGFERLMGWADGKRRLGVRANADTPRQARLAVALGAEGIGLCRTEHMFFEQDRIVAVREMILANDLDGRARALGRLLPMQRDDFAGIFRAMEGRPVTIRTLDPPLHEFLPHGRSEISALAERMSVPVERLAAKVDELRETNPMLGHRGCRLGISYPEITAMQARAVFEAAVQVDGEGVPVRPEVMIPLVGHVRELELQREVVDRAAEEVFAAAGRRVSYLVGTMIELPRAAVTAGQVVAAADFFSFGTNDLTQTTFGLSRDDAGKFLPEYVRRGILSANPFQVLDREGVGALVRLAVEQGRARRPDLKVGICGEHGGDPTSVAFCEEIGLDYVSCSPFRLPVARLAAAHAALGPAS
jgi:pyruvate,orthophosphate dikinase